MDADDNKTEIEKGGGRIDVNGNQDDIDKKEEADQRAANEKEEDGNRTKSENERRFEEDMATIELNKPWPPLLKEMQGKPRSYSDTSQMRAVSKAINEDIRSCTSYMHFPHITGLQLKRIRELQGSSSTPHLHHSFSRMHLPHISDPWDPGEDFPTVSVIALAEERDRVDVDDSIEDKEADSKDDFAMSDEENEESSNEARVKEHAIYTWNREVGRTRSLSEPPNLLAQKENAEQRPRAMSMESADKAKKPPSRLQFQATLSGLEEEHPAEMETESDAEGREHSQSILVLAESSEMIPESEPSDHIAVQSDSSDEILTRWTRHDNKRRSSSFSTDLATIDENKDEINSLLPLLSGSSGTPSVQALVDEVTKDVIDRSSDGRIVSTGDPSENESEDSTAHVDPSNVLKRRLTLPLASPLRKTQTDYATKMEREAFDKISQWKTKFASKLEDILRKGVDQETEEKNKQVKKSIVLDIPLNLSPEQLQNLKKNMINELKQKSSQGDVKEILLTPKESRRFKPKIKKDPSNVADEFKQISTSDVHKEKKLDPSELLERLHHLQRQTRRDEPTSSVARGFDGISDAREKIAELLHWHDQERNNLQREMETMLAAEKPSSSSSSSLPQMSIEKESLEKVFLSLQAVTDTIFRETISRLKGTIDNGFVTGGEHKDEIPSKKVDKVEKSHQVVDDKLVKDAICQTSPFQSQIPVPVKRNRSPKARSSSKGFKSTEGKEMTSKGHVPNHVHTTSIGEHFCHKETCVGVEDDTESSLYTAEESSAHSCECDFASEGNSPSEKEVSTSDSYGNKYGMLSCSTTTGELESSSSTMKSLDSDAIESKKRRKKIGQFPYDSSDEETGEADVSDACSEIADLLGVYRVYNLNNDRDGELTRPQAPEPMTYEERDAFEKVRRQKIQLKSNKRKIREFKSKNKRLKEQMKQLEIQQREWREDFLIKDNRISDLKREVDHLSFVMQKYKKALEDKSNIIKHKEKQIIKLLQSESDDSGDRSREMERQLKKALDDNIRLQLKLNNKGDGGEPVFSYENTSSSEFQAKLESAYRRTSELEQELKESKMKLFKYIAEKESIFGESEGSEIVDELKEIINQKDKKIKELRNQHNEEVQELTQEISEVMTDRDRLVQELSEIRPLKESENLEKNNLALKEEIRQLAKALADAEAKCKEKAEGNGMSVFLEQTQDHPVTDGREQELKLLKTAVEGYKLMIQRLLDCKGIGNQKEENLEYQEKLGTMARLAYERCERLESDLKEAVAAKDNETVKLQETEIRLQKADQQLQDMNNFVYTSQSGSLEELKNKLQMLEEENFQLKKQITPASERANGATFLIEITELQAKLAQSDLEIKELQHKLNDAEARLRQARTTTALEAGASSFSNYAFTEKKYDSLAQRYKRQWDEEAELHQQELDEMRGVYRNQAPPSNGEKEVYKLRQDLKTIKEALDDIVKGQGRTKSDLHNELASVLEEKEKEMVRQESMYKQMMEMREKLFSELLNEKNHIIQMLKDQSHKEVNPDLQSDVIAKKIKALMEKDLTPKLDELKIQMESVITKSDEMVQGDMVSDALKKNDSKMTQIEKCTEETWSKVKDELAELKDFTFEMADAIEKDIFSSHEQFLDFVKCNSDDIIKCVTDEGHVTRKSVLDQLQATRQSRDATKFEEFYNSLDTFGKRNSRELRQARRDVLLAAEAVTNTADELYHLKTALETKFSVNDVVNKDELARRIELINAQEEVKELRKTVSDAQLAAETLQKMEQEYAEKAKSIESNLLMKEMKFVDLVNTDQGGNDGLRRNPLFSSQDDERLRDTFYSSASSSGEMQGPSRIEDDHRRGYNSLTSQTPPSRDYVTLRERLQKKAKEKLISEGLYQEPYSSMALSRDTPSSS